MAKKITVENLQKRIPINPRQIKRIAKTILEREGVLDVDLSIVFVTDSKIRSLNKRFLNHDYATDVLAFDLSDDCLSFRKHKRKPKSMVGDIIISTMTASRQTKTFHTPIQQEIILYLIHGILHLLGYDHHKPADMKTMRAQEKELLSVFI